MPRRHQWCHKQSWHVGQKYKICHEPIFFRSSLVNSQPRWLLPEVLKFKAKSSPFIVVVAVGWCFILSHLLLYTLCQVRQNHQMKHADENICTDPFTLRYRYGYTLNKTVVFFKKLDFCVFFCIPVDWAFPHLFCFQSINMVWPSPSSPTETLSGLKQKYI